MLSSPPPTILIVTHNIQVARTVPDNIGMLFRGSLVMFGPREVLLTSAEPAVAQFLGGRRDGPIGMAEEKDDATLELERVGGGGHGEDRPVMVPQLAPTAGLPERRAVARRRERLMRELDRLPGDAQAGILAGLTEADRARYGIYAGGLYQRTSAGEP